MLEKMTDLVTRVYPNDTKTHVKNKTPTVGNTTLEHTKCRVF